MKNTLKKLRTGAMVTLAGATMLMSGVVNADEVTTVVTSTDGVSTEAPVTEADIANAQAAVETAQQAFTEAENAYSTYPAVSDSEIRSAEASLDLAESTPVVGQDGTATLQADVTEAQRAYEQARDEAFSYREAQEKARLEFELANQLKPAGLDGVGVTVTPDAVTEVTNDFTTTEHESKFGDPQYPTQLEPIYADGATNYNMGEKDPNFKLEAHIEEYRTEVINYIKKAREVNGLPSGEKVGVTAEEQALAHEIAQKRVDEILSGKYPNDVHKTDLDYSSRGYYFTEGVGSYVVGDSAKESAFKLVQNQLQDFQFNNSLGHATTLLGMNDVIYGVHYRDNVAVIVYLMDKYSEDDTKSETYWKHRDDGVTLVPSDVKQSGVRSLSEGGTTAKKSFIAPPLDVQGYFTNSNRGFYKDYSELFESIYGNPTEVTFNNGNTGKGFTKNYTGGQDQAIYVVTPSTGTVVRAKYLTKDTFTYRVTTSGVSTTVVNPALEAYNKRLADARSKYEEAQSLYKEYAVRASSALAKYESAKKALDSATSKVGYPSADAKVADVEKAKATLATLTARKEEATRLKNEVEVARRNMVAASDRLYALRTKFARQGVSTTKPVTGTTSPVTSTTKPVVTTTKPATETKPEAPTGITPLVPTSTVEVVAPKPTTGVVKPVTEVAQPLETTNKPVTDSVPPQKTAETPSLLEQFQAGDFSAIAGTWVNGKGQTITISREGNTSTGNQLTITSNPTSSTGSLALGDYKTINGVAVGAVIEYATAGQTFQTTGAKDNSDISRDRLHIAQYAYTYMGNREAVYYRLAPSNQQANPADKKAQANTRPLATPTAGNTPAPAPASQPLAGKPAETVAPTPTYSRVEAAKQAQATKATLPNTGDASSVLGVLGGLITSLGLVGFKKKGE